ncbi:STAS domain-containing protein [Bacillus sp. ISL-47]|uniref:STAS domain-containing protein n=1 Tax=Bacillus sp. ISL-47 TaxID=2819130 RepID=UPI001BE7A781|nr:STAS domain-containing protein [Bacillus sp. ISL-47]MBT2690901.1 STAS domain-containing protein [Bacillus sp. ISL-47]MBT2710677.1 STAS domain-containing protein [Pseudomonas sp. ISL-84]
MQSLKDIGQEVLNQRFEITKQFNELLEEGYVKRLKASQRDLDAVNEWRSRLIGFLGEAIMARSSETVAEKVAEWAKVTGEGAVESQLPLDKALKTISVYRSLTWKLIKEYVKTHSVDPIELIEISDIIDPILDNAASLFSSSYVNDHKRSLDLAKEAIQELSVPVIALTKDVAILPLIGELDTYRSKVLIEKSLQKCSELKVNTLIIDMSGVAIIDTMVGHEIFQVVKALNLIGVKTILTGLRPEIAQSVVQLGVSFANIQVMSNLQAVISQMSKENSI